MMCPDFIFIALKIRLDNFLMKLLYWFVRNFPDASVYSVGEIM